MIVSKSHDFPLRLSLGVLGKLPCSRSSLGYASMLLLTRVSFSTLGVLAVRMQDCDLAPLEWSQGLERHLPLVSGQLPNPQAPSRSK